MDLTNTRQKYLTKHIVIPQLNLSAFLYPVTGRIFTNFETKSENNAKKIDY